MKNIVIYHKGCPDGFGAAWAIRHIMPENTCYIEKSPKTSCILEDDICGADIVIVDLTFKRDVLLEIKKRANSLLVIDHHKTALKEVGDLDFVQIDLNHSGAFLAWKYAQTKKPSIGDPPLLIRLIEDRDLWKWEINNSKKALAAIDSYPFDFDIWDQLSQKRIEELLPIGEVVDRLNLLDIERTVNRAKVISFLNFKVPVALCVNQRIKSELGNILSKGFPFSVLWRPTGDSQVSYSLRSQKEGEDVSKICETFGGGGHKNAAGFTGPISLIEEFL